MSNRNTHPVTNAGSMADIAFLLLIFFLIATTIKSEWGINITLPTYKEPPTEKAIGNPNNKFLKLALNYKNELMMNGMTIAPQNLGKQINSFIINTKNQSIRYNPIINFTYDRGTNYENYLNVFTEINAAYEHLWDDIAEDTFQKRFYKLTQEDRKKIMEKYPKKINEYNVF